jgi:hypothetical protein
MKCVLFFLFVAISLQVSSQDFLEKWDFDQDGKNDSVYFEYTGGAHCCYNIRIKTSHDNKTWEFETNMDGGYVMGPDDSQPEHFNIMNYDADSAPEIFMETGTYNGDDYGRQTFLLDYHDGHFFKKYFDIYEYRRSLDSVTCTGMLGIFGYYVARSDDATKGVFLHSSGIVEYDARPRGVAGWEDHYDGKWELKDSTLTIIFLFQREAETWGSSSHEELPKPIVHQYVYVKSECMFRELHSKDADYFYKE